MSMSKTYTVATPDEFRIIDPDNIKNITFHDKTQESPIGKISWDSGVFKFEGKTEQSADIFFNHVLKGICDQYIQSAKTLDHSIKQMILQCYQQVADDPKYVSLAKEIKTFFTA